MADLEQYQQDFRDRCDAKIAERQELEERRAAAASLAQAVSAAAQLRAARDEKRNA